MADPRGSYEQGIRARDRGLQQLDSVTGQILRLSGLIDITMAPDEALGEALIEIPFPVLFIELPGVSDGMHLFEGERIVAGQFPVVRSFVNIWRFKEYPGGTRHYTGANLGMVVTGHPGMRCTLHYHFEAKAVVPPADLTHQATDVV